MTTSSSQSTMPASQTVNPTPAERDKSPLFIHDLTVAYHRKPVLWDVDFLAPEGRLIGIMGPNGAGKSTLIKATLDLIPRASGKVLVYGKPYQKQRHLVGYVPQRESVDWDFPVSALDVVAMGLYGKIGWFGRVKQTHRHKALEALDRIGMADYADRQISQLSGGQQQRVSLARSLVKNAKILLLDEPLVNLDYKLREQLREEFKNLFSKGLADETILIYSTTDPRETMELNGEVIVLDEGKVLQVGSAKEIFENPNSLKVAEISNDPPMNIIEAKISDNQINFEGIEVKAPKHLSKLTEDGLKIGLRSSDIELHENGHEFEVELAEISGSETLLHLKRGNTKVIVLIEEVLNFKIHDKVKINFKIDRAYAFHADGKLASSPFRGLNG